VTVTGLKLIAGHQQGREGTRLGLTEIRVQKHLLFPGRHLLYRAADILREKKTIITKKVMILKLAYFNYCFHHLNILM